MVNPRCKWSLRSGTACNSLLCSLGIYRLLKEDDNQCCFFKFVNTVQRIYWTYDRSRLSDGCCNIIFKKGSQFKQKNLSTRWTVKGWKSTLPSLPGGSLEMTLTVPLTVKFCSCKYRIYSDSAFRNIEQNVRNISAI